MCAGWFETRPIAQNIIRAALPGRQPRSPSRPAPNLRGAPHLSSTALLLSRSLLLTLSLRSVPAAPKASVRVGLAV